MALKTEFAGNIEQAENTDRRIDQQTTQVDAGVTELALQRAIDPHPQFPYVAEEVANTSLHRQRHCVVVHLGNRFGSVLVNRLMHCEHRAIEALVGVMRILFGNRIANAGQGEQATQGPGSSLAHAR